MNLRTLINFFNERLCNRAEIEIRTVAKKMKKAIKDCPEINDIEWAVLNNVFVPKCMRYEVAFCREYDGCGRYKSLKELDNKEYRIFYRNNKKPIWNEFIYENIELVDNGVAAIGKKL